MSAKKGISLGCLQAFFACPLATCHRHTYTACPGHIFDPLKALGSRCTASSSITINWTQHRRKKGSTRQTQIEHEEHLRARRREKSMGESMSKQVKTPPIWGLSHMLQGCSKVVVTYIFSADLEVKPF